MFKVIEVHISYISSIATILVHLIIVFYALYIIKTGIIDYQTPGATDKKVIWYQTPKIAEKPLPAIPTYEKPTVEKDITKAPEYEADSTQPLEHVQSSAELIDQPLQDTPAPERRMRSRSERQSAWKKPAPQEPDELKQVKPTAATLVDALSQELALQRQAQAVYTKQEAVKQSVAAQMREITQSRLRHKIFSALQMAFDAHKKDFYSPVPIMSNFDISIIINQKGEIIAVEVLRSTGTPALDAHLIEVIQAIKKIALPPSATGKEFYTMTFSSKVTIAAGSGHIIFDYKDASGIHIV